MNINNKAIEAMDEVGISARDGIPYLISLYYGYEPTYIPDELKLKMNRTGIFERKFKGADKLFWKIKLFDEQETNFGWVKAEYIGLFEAVNEERKGSGTMATARMKKFFATYPQYRKEDILAATQMYLDNVTDPRFVITSHYFISKGAGVDKSEPLLEWCEKLDVAKRSAQARSSNSNTMI